MKRLGRGPLRCTSQRCPWSLHRWSAHHRGPAVSQAAHLALAHSEASADFGFLTAVAPDHQVTVSVIDKQTQAPIEHVEIRCGSYRAVTDESGLAKLELPTGKYELSAWKLGYDDAPARTVDVTSDLLIHVETEPTPEKNADDERVWM